jgi:hypothetical protein
MYNLSLQFQVITIEMYHIVTTKLKSDCAQARCRTCLKIFSAHAGTTTLRKHINRDFYTTLLKLFEKSTSIPLSLLL